MSAAAQAAGRPPAFAPDMSGRIAFAVLLAYCAYAASRLEVTAERLATGLGNGARFLSRMFPPVVAQADSLANGMLESLEIATLATFLGILVALPVGLLAARNLMPGWVSWPARGLIAACRSFHPVIVAILFVKAVGFGALAGILALTVASVGFIGKLFAEAIEEISLKQVEAVRATGAGFANVLAYGVLPQVFSRFIGFATYQMDSNLRNSTMVGIVGAGGIGGTLFSAFQRFDYDFVCAILITIIGVIFLGELLAARVRGVFVDGLGLRDALLGRAAPRGPSESGAPQGGRWRRFTPAQARARITVNALLLAALLASAGAVEIIPEFIYDAPEQMADLLRRMWPVDWAHYPAVVHDALVETLHIATLGTLLAIAMALPLGLMAARNVTPFAPLNWLARLALVSSRSVNSLVWALLFVGVFGPGALAGTLAIAFRSVGFVGKLVGEALEEASAGSIEALRATGAPWASVVLKGYWPQVQPAFWSVALFRWDINVRESAVLGLVGAGGIGVALDAAINLFEWQRVATVLTAIFAVVVLAEVAVTLIRRRVL